MSIYYNSRVCRMRWMDCCSDRIIYLIDVPRYVPFSVNPQSKDLITKVSKVPLQWRDDWQLTLYGIACSNALFRRIFQQFLARQCNRGSAHIYHSDSSLRPSIPLTDQCLADPVSVVQTLTVLGQIVQSRATDHKGYIRKEVQLCCMRQGVTMIDYLVFRDL